MGLVKHCYLTVLLLFVMELPASASSRDPGKVIAGWVEKVTFNALPVAVKAKLDTGAKTSSLHATNIALFKKNNQYWVRFTLNLKDSNGKLHTVQLEKPRSRKVKIKNHDGEHDRRPVVTLNFCFDGRQHSTDFTLTDRAEYIYPVLLGRTFLQGIAVVDPDSTFLTQASCDKEHAK